MFSDGWYASTVPNISVARERGPTASGARPGESPGDSPSLPESAGQSKTGRVLRAPAPDTTMPTDISVARERRPRRKASWRWRPPPDATGPLRTQTATALRAGRRRSREDGSEEARGRQGRAFGSGGSGAVRSVGCEEDIPHAVPAHARLETRPVHTAAHIRAHACGRACARALRPRGRAVRHSAPVRSACGCGCPWAAHSLQLADDRHRVVQRVPASRRHSGRMPSNRRLAPAGARSLPRAQARRRSRCRECRCAPSATAALDDAVGAGKAGVTTQGAGAVSPGQW